MGGEGIASNLFKGPINKAFDAQLNYQDNGRYVNREIIRNALADPTNDFVDILRDLFKVPDVVTDYVAQHWYNRNTASELAWWKDKQPIEPIMRQSTIEAIDLAQDLPIDSYWSAIGNRDVHPNNYPTGTYRPDEYSFEVILVRSDVQLTRIILTPPSPRMLNPDALTQLSNIWVIKDSNEPQPVGDTRTTNGISTTQLYEYSGEYVGQDLPPEPYRRG